MQKRMRKENPRIQSDQLEESATKSDEQILHVLWFSWLMVDIEQVVYSLSGQIAFFVKNAILYSIC